MRADAQMGVHCTNILQDGSVVGQLSTGARSDFLDLARDLSTGGAIILRFERPLHGIGQERRDFVDLGPALRTNVDLGARLTGNGVDTGAALDDAEVIRRSGVAAAWKSMLGKISDRPRQSMHGVGNPIVAPTVSAGAADGDIETAAGERLRSDVVGVRPVQN